ncbi:MAG: sulfonate ABC transporter substrate-binding protein [Proteobacteria bacterium]|nr:sulfonate ABC transporter substrate-binding protein [Pseudomonadota bacterium]
MNRFKSARRHALGLLLGLGLLPAFHGAQAAEPEVLRLGYQKYGTLVLLKAQASLEKRLAPLGVSVKWVEFPSGPALLEALNVGAIDFGQAGETPPIFAQAAGANLVYVGNEPPEPAGEAIVVTKDSPLKTVAELKGKKIALNKGSNVHYLLVRVLEKAGLQYKDVETVFLPPADARAAFERGSVDAWVIWDPFLAAAEKQIGARVLADGKGAVNNHAFFLASRPYAEKHGPILTALLDELAKSDQWASQNRKEVARQIAPLLGLDLATTELAVNRQNFGVKPISDTVAAEQQRIADTFHQLKLIPKPVLVKDALLPKR